MKKTLAINLMKIRFTKIESIVRVIISERLYLSIKTIETYRAHIKEKLNLADAAEMLQYAIQWVNSRNNV